MDRVKARARRTWQKTQDGFSYVWNGVKTRARKTKEKFERHPNSIDQSYRGHMWKSLKASSYAFWISFQYLIHACFPFLFEKHCDMDERQRLFEDEISVSEVEHEEMSSDNEM